MSPTSKTPRHPPRTGGDLADVEVELILEGIFRVYGFDFRDYVRSAMLRRILAFAREERVRTLSGLQERLLHDPPAFRRFLGSVASKATTLFRQPGSYRAFRKRVAPVLQERARLRFWSLGCATGEEAYSLAVLLREEGLEARSQVYATAIDETSLRQAARGSFPLEALRAAETDYRAAGGRGRLSDHYRAEEGHGVFHPEVRRNVLFAAYNLATDVSFNEFDVILCRNVLTEFQPTLQARVHRLIRDSLARAGVLALGRGDGRPPFENLYEPIDSDNGLFRRVG